MAISDTDRKLLFSALSVSSALPKYGSASEIQALQFSPHYVAMNLPPLNKSSSLKRLKSKLTHSMAKLKQEADLKIKELKNFAESAIQEHLPAGWIIAKIEEAIQSFQNATRVRAGGKMQESPLVNHGFAAILPGDGAAQVVFTSSILNFLNIYNTLLVVRLVLTWFPEAPPVIVNPLRTICDPYLNLFRGIIPPLGGTLDFSPILAFLVLNVFTSTAEALPAELPPSYLNQQQNSSVSSSASDVVTLTAQQRELIFKNTGISLVAPAVKGTSESL